MPTSLKRRRQRRKILVTVAAERNERRVSKKVPRHGFSQDEAIRAPAGVRRLEIEIPDGNKLPRRGRFKVYERLLDARVTRSWRGGLIQTARTTVNARTCASVQKRFRRVLSGRSDRPELGVFLRSLRCSVDGKGSVSGTESMIVPMAAFHGCVAGDCGPCLSVVHQRLNTCVGRVGERQ
jgi:hypothetical protein